MPPEPLPWDRKEYAFKDHKKNERGDALGGGGGGGGSSSASRWRDPYHGPRDLPRASPRRPLSGHYRQGGSYHQVHPEDSSGHGCTPSRSDRFWFEEDGFRPLSVRYGGGCRSSSGGSSRDSRGSFRRSPYWDSGDSRQHHHDPHATAQRPVAAPISCTSQTSQKEQNDKNDGVDDSLDTGHRFDHRDNSLVSIPWKKWSRPGSLVSAKTGRSELGEAGLETGLPLGKETPMQSPVISSLPSDEGVSKKKPRLGWGQGLAKYEKQKVEGSTETSVGGGKGASSDNGQQVTGISGCLSPTTSQSATCSSSPAGTEDKPCSRTVNDDNGMSQNSDLPGSTLRSFCEEVSIDLDHLEASFISSLYSLLADLFQSEDAFSGDSTFTKHSALNKLLKLKGDISNGLEKIECEIDLLEKGLKSLDCDAKACSYQTSFNLANDSAAEACIQPLVGVPNESNHLKDQNVDLTQMAYVQHVPCNSLVEHGTIVEDNNVIHLETSSSKIGFGIEKLSESHSSIEDERLKSSEVQQTVDSDDGGRLMVASEDGNRDYVDRGSVSACISSDETLRGNIHSNLITSIMDFNKNSSEHAWKLLGTSLPTNPLQSDIWGLVNLTACRKNDLTIKEKLSIRKCQVKFKERVLTLKFKALHHLWKEDLRLLYIRKLRTKSTKRFELSNRSSQNGSQKQRSSIRSRFALPAGNLTLVPTTEIVDFTGKLLSDSLIKLYRNNLKMPALILDDKEKTYSRFVTQNGLIEDPLIFEKERATINPWSQDEKVVFMEMLAKYGKDFARISLSLNHKTTADCIEFYYKNHKSESFKEVKKCLDLRKQQQCLRANTYLVASGNKWNHEISCVSPDRLASAPIAVAHGHGTARSEKNIGSVVYGTYNDVKVPYLEGANSVNISGEERESVAADVLAGIRGALFSEAMSSCDTSSIDPSEKMNCITADRLLTPEITQNLDEDDCSDEGSGELDSADWTDDEKSIFVQALSMYGKDFTRISSCMRRSRDQCKIFFSKARKCLGLDVILQGTVNAGMPLSDTNGGRSDTDDACVAEMNSAICSTQSCTKMGVDASQSVANISYEGIAHVASTHFHVETERSNKEDEDVSAGPDLDGGGEKVDTKYVSTIHDDELVREADNLQSDACPKEIIVDALGGTKAAQLCKVTDSADTETKVGRIANIISPTKSVVTIRKTDPVAIACMDGQSKQLTASIVHKTGTDGSYPADGLKEVDSKASPTTEVGLSNKKSINNNFTAIGNGSLNTVPDSNASGAPLLSGNKVNVCHRLTFGPNYQQQMQLDLLPCVPKKHQTVLLKQEDVHSIPLNSFLPDPSSVCFGGPIDVSSETTLNFEEHGSKWHQNMVKRDIYQQYITRNLPVNQVDHNMHILRGYPLQALNQEVKRETDLPAGEKRSLLETESKRCGVSQSNQFFMSDMHWNKSDPSHSRSSMSCPSRSENHSEAELRTCVKNACSEIEEHRTGDVKLFGKILSHTCSLQKSGTSSHESNVPSSPKLDGCSTANSACIVKDGNRLVSDVGNGQVGLEDPPARTYGFWDGKRVQNGNSSLPDTTAMLAKYQGSLAGVSFYSTKDAIPIRNGVVTDYPQSCMQQLSSDGKRIENIPELQKRNAIGIVSGFQQQGRVTPLGANMMGGGGILVGGGGVSDPVAALKMHYAARASVGSTDMMESWRGDMGGR
ncbi:uncharacterized protein LOC135677213 isoform X1 [Musa acuminata AAA Group]|uniref:uncharacterized protein LOC135677213 isoform X1 n=1 Tax=Musa acuminata AAA Group TaxID=214697 RepID=UPI0031DA5178